MLRNLLAAVAIFAVVGSAIAQAAPKKADDKTLVTKVYDLKPLLGERGKVNGFAEIDAVFKAIFEVIEVGELKPGTEGPQLIERDAGKLEVRATAKVQQEIADLIEAMMRLTDLAIDIKADVIELDPATFEKWQKALPNSGKGKVGSPVVLARETEMDERELTREEKKAYAAAHAILQTGKVVQTSSARFSNGVESTFSARLSVQTFNNTEVNKKPTAPPMFVKDGFKLVGLPVVSADRRFVRLKLTEQSTAVIGIKKQDFGEVVKGQKFVLTSLETEDLGSTGSTVVADGSRTAFRLAYAPKDKVWVVVLHPTIFIQAEEDFRKKEEKK
ncbi:MAG: hypothetical protein K8U57_24555 [Planctomycetes bacterium]|nr:hypothetical protein [Planctomycetota bacterium]